MPLCAINLSSSGSDQARDKLLFLNTNRVQGEIHASSPAAGAACGVMAACYLAKPYFGGTEVRETRKKERWSIHILYISLSLPDMNERTLCCLTLLPDGLACVEVFADFAVGAFYATFGDAAFALV